MAALAVLPGCSGSPLMGRDGPSFGRIKAAGTTATQQGQTALLVDVDGTVAHRISDASRQPDFTQTFGAGQPYGSLIGAGDALQVTMFETPPAVLFIASSATTLAASSGQRGMSLPEVQVDSAGQVDIPFAGRLTATGRTPQQLAAAIVARLRGKAHDPQAVVSITRPVSSSVTVVGEVMQSTRLPLTFKGERLLDAIAAAGGTRQPVNKVSLQLNRNGAGVSMGLDELIARPDQNIYLRPGDVVTVSYQPASFTVLGAAGKNDEINFEARGITLAQALGRIGGLRDDRANPGGMFIFRMEDPAVLGAAVPPSIVPVDGKIPVIYRIDLRNPATFFAAQRFAMHDRDLVYVTNAPAADLQKFVNIISAAVYPIVTIKAAGF